MLSYLDDADDRLAVVRFGATDADNHPGPGLTLGIANPSLPGCPRQEIWPASGAVEPVDIEGGLAAADGRYLAVSIERSLADTLELETAALQAYRCLLSGVGRAGYPFLLRVWNYVPDIHAVAGGLDGYMRFCAGRSEAFRAHFGDGFPAALPAASAVGRPGRSLVIHALAGREPGRHVENPRQVSAYRYPSQYGPKSPSFARGTVTPQGHVFVSGTSSIVGHESVFAGDPSLQTRETLRNIAAVLDAAGAGRPGDPLACLLSLRVYVRRPEDQDAIRSELAAGVGRGIPTAWLQAQICREDLLVEIEATALPQLG